MGEHPPIAPAAPLTLAEAAAQVLSEQTRVLRKLGRRVRRGRDPEDVHQMRVATRRLRAALRMLRGQLVVDPRVRRSLRWLAGHLGRVRDDDVILALLGTHVPKASGAEGRRLVALVASLARARAKARRRLRGALDRPRYRRLVRRLARTASAPAVAGDPDRLAARALTDATLRLARDAEREQAMVDPSPSPEALHRLRIAFKRLRYVLDFHAATGGPAYDVERDLARSMQDVLGAVHDHDLLMGWLVAGAGPFAGPWPVLGARLQRNRATLYRKFLRLRREWRERTRGSPSVATLEEPRFVHLEPRSVTLRLVTGGKHVASTMIS